MRLAFKTAWRAEWNDLRAHVLSISRHFYEFRPGFLSLLSLEISRAHMVGVAHDEKQIQESSGVCIRLEGANFLTP